MSQRPSWVSRSLLAGAALALGASWWLVPSATVPPLSLDVLDLALFVLAAGVLELLTIRTTDGREVNTAVAIVAAAAILGAAPPIVALVAVFGALIAALRLPDMATLEVLVRRALMGWMLAGIAGIGMLLGPPVWDGSSQLGTPASIDLGAAATVGVSLLVGGPLLAAVGRSQRSWRFVLPRIGDTITSEAPRQAAIVSTAVLGALVHPVLGAWTLPTMLIPLAAVRIGLDREGQVARAYDQTIRAMSRLPEQLGELDEGHGVRVAELAREVAFELGFDAEGVRRVGQAAHLHELGRVQLERPDTVEVAQLAGRPAIAAAGAAVVRRAPGMEQVAAIVAGHGDLAAAEPEIQRAARIVTACCDIDRYAPDPRAGGQRHEVIVRLVREIGDLEIVSTLDRILDRRDLEAGVVPPVDA
ncbi:MAG: hypothetical protein JJT89_15045 [Nitriliruptoraceae bacterium]|nr:hypothetical protein [Nitriliruptoraceae bacterium]